MDAILAAEVRSCLLRSDALGRAFAAGRLTPAVLEKKEALLMEKNGIITGYVGEIYFFKSVALPLGGWRLIKKNQDVYFLRRLGRAHLLHPIFHGHALGPGPGGGRISLSRFRPEISPAQPLPRRRRRFFL